jgi:hypothetical protein
MRLAQIALILGTISMALAGDAPHFAGVMERRPEAIWAQSISKQLRESVEAFQQHKKLPNGVVYGSTIRDLNLTRTCEEDIFAWAKKHGCSRKNDFIKNPADNSPRLDARGKTIPLVSLLCKDGGVIRLKPEGDPTYKKNPDPNAVKAMRFFGVDRYDSFEDEAFKIDDAGMPIPKWSKDLNVELPELTSGDRDRYIEEWAKDAHSPLKHCK